MEMQTSESSAFGQLAGMASNSSHSHISYDVLNSALGSWMDTRDSDHMTFSSNLFSKTTPLHSSIFVTLRDGILKPVTIIGDILLSPTLTLHGVVYVPNFKYNR